MSDSGSENAIKRTRNIEISENIKRRSSRIQRMRYWTNYEELRLVELWRRHILEIPSYDKNLPIHRTIADGMKERRLHLNGQECRRRMNGMRNKYLAECKRLKESTTAEKSDWYLFPYIHSIFNPRIPNSDPNHEQITLQRVHDTLHVLRPSLRKVTPYHSYKRIQYSHDPDTFPFLPQKLLYKNVKEDESAAAAPRLPLQVHMPNSQSTPSANTTTTNTPTPTINQSRSVRLFPALPIQITMETVELLRLENDMLATQRDNELKMLKYKEVEVEQLQKGFAMVKENNLKSNLDYLKCLMTMT